MCLEETSSKYYLLKITKTSHMKLHNVYFELFVYFCIIVEILL